MENLIDKNVYPIDKQELEWDRSEESTKRIGFIMNKSNANKTFELMKVLSRNYIAHPSYKKNWSK